MKTTILLIICTCCLYFIQVAAQSSTKPPETVYTECGGEVWLKLGEDAYIEYKNGQDTNKNERCQWTLRSDQQNTYIVKAILLSAGFRESGIAVYTVDPYRSNLSSYNINQVEVEFEVILNPLTFVNYASENYYVSQGFKLRLQLSAKEESPLNLPTTSVFHFTTWHDYFRHENYLNDERVYVIISPPNIGREYFRLLVNFTDIEYCEATCDCDFIDVHRIQGVESYQHITKICGDVENGTILTSQSWDPILAVFHSNNVTTGEGFQIMWEQHQ